jgi:hypothetical protein
MKFFRLLVYDLKEGFRYNRYKYLVMTAALSFSVAWFGISLHNGYQYGFIQDVPSLSDLMLYLLRGMPVYHPRQGEEYILPVIWILIQTMLFYLAGYYPQQDIYRFGQQIFLRSYKKRNWWYSKCIWCAATVTVFYAIVFLIAVLGCVSMGGNFSAGFSAELAKFFYGVDLSGITVGQLWFQLTVMPWVISLSMCLFQMMLSFFIGAPISFVLVISVMIASTYVPSKWLIGNYSMIVRCVWINPTEGYNSEFGLIMALALGCFSVFGGALRMKKYDVLTKG